MNEITIGRGTRLDPSKFQDPDQTADGSIRAQVSLERLDTLWFNTGTLCNLECENCYIESSPTNDRLVYLRAAEVDVFLNEINSLQLGTRKIGFTGGEPFMNPDFMAMLSSVLERNFETLILTNAMRPMAKCADALLNLPTPFRGRLTFRVSLDHYTKPAHERIRGDRSWGPAIAGLKWLSDNGFAISAASRTCWDQDETQMRNGFTELFATENIRIDAQNPTSLILFPEMDESLDIPEITERCWEVLNVSPKDLMCAQSRMVVKRKGDNAPTISPCTLLPYAKAFDLGTTLRNALTPVKLNHPHCAKFCVLGGASCSISADM